MQGSLWKQAVNSDVAEELTHGPGYDFQPDVSADGKRIVFVRYAHDAMELALVDAASGRVTPLTSNGAVNVEPRWSLTASASRGYRPPAPGISMCSSGITRRKDWPRARVRSGGAKRRAITTVPSITSESDLVA